MSLTKIKKGLNVPISGDPVQVISAANPSQKVALVGYDYPGMKPVMAVAEYDKVKLGQVLFTDRKMPGVNYTSPAAGTVVEVNRGTKRVFESIVIKVDEKEEENEITFESFNADQLDSLDPEKVKNLLIESGMWTSLRARPFGKVADPAVTPHSLFITTMDTNPLAPSPEVILQDGDNGEAFKNGLTIASRLTEGKLYLCKAPGASIPTISNDRLSVEEFGGPHPAGNAGTHIHYLDPVDRHKTVWQIDLQDVIALGKFFTSGRIPVERIVSLAGPQVEKPRLVRTRIGAGTDYIVADQLKDSPFSNRVISGSVLSGRTAAGHMAYLGRYHNQVVSLEDGVKRRFLGWLNPGANLYSVKNVVLSSFLPKKKFAFSTAANGDKRAVFPAGSYEQIMPMDTEIVYLLRALMVDDIEEAENLGCLEMVEEDLSLCSYVSPAKIEYGEVLRRNLTIIEKEG
ncbi:MAG: Na(+)-translocating NADH-quinone reductase subunit A [bacterium]|nr:Na(+)-translocating NADH-quinone reductase subunit A [bacterium]